MGLFGVSEILHSQVPQSVRTLRVGGFVLGSLILYRKGMRRMMFQLSGFYYGVYGLTRVEGFGV